MMRMFILIAMVLSCEAFGETKTEADLRAQLAASEARTKLAEARAVAALRDNGIQHQKNVAGTLN
jgi:hypothetical protein